MHLFRVIASALRALLALINPAARRAAPALHAPGQAAACDEEEILHITDRAELTSPRNWPGLTDGSTRTVDDLVTLLGQAGSDMQARRAAAPAAAATTPPQEDPAVTASALASYHHPHFISAEPQGDRVLYQFRPFTGREEPPQRPEASHTDSRLTGADKDVLHYEYRAAWDAWWQAKCRRENDEYQRRALYSLRQAAPDWTAYAGARAVMDQAWAEVHTTGDDRWHARLLALAEAHAETMAAAERWDRTARDIAWAREEHERSVGEDYALRLADIAAGSGLDISGWLIDPYSSYTSEGYWHESRTPLAGVVHREIERQRKLLQDTANLASAPAAS
jgi:hypothetical protein